jgi:hypothetical protein
MPQGAHQSDHFREGGIGLRGAAARSALRGGRASGTGRGQGPMSVADNLGSHKGDAVRNAIRDVGACLVFLPKILPTQPHRAGLRQVQNSAPKGASANYEGSPTPAAKFRPPHAPHTSRRQERVEPKAGYSRRLSQRVRCSNPYLTRRARSHLPGPGTAPKLKACSRVLSSWPKIGTL